jgi:hypothetical protein
MLQGPFTTCYLARKKREREKEGERERENGLVSAVRERKRVCVREFQSDQHPSHYKKMFSFKTTILMICSDL